ncbi:MAG TPA: AAA family ATPase [Candidatus Saccharimonadales bacterium]|nr:AAA family ATPase [Candidatus Saccharimonadales bacterium]
MNKPKLIVMSGLPGSGKSTLSERIAASLKIPVFSVDPIESAIIKAGIPKSFETGYAAYLVAEALAKEQIKLGNSVVIDAVNAENEAKQVWIDCATSLKISMVVIECMLKDASLHRKRLEARIRGLHGFDEITWERVQERRKAYTPWQRDVLTVEMSNGSDENLKVALDFITWHP